MGIRPATLVQLATGAGAGAGASAGLEAYATLGEPSPGRALASILVSPQMQTAGAISTGIMVPLLLVFGRRNGMASAAAWAGAAMVGGLVGDNAFRKLHRTSRPESYRANDELLQQQVNHARERFAELGAPKRINGPIDIANRGSYFNASYSRTLPVLHDISALSLHHGREQITAGRKFDTGESWALAPDVMYHEYGHRIVTQMLPNMGLRGESGAIHESLSDTFAAAFDDGDWTVGESPADPDGIRSLKDPTNPSYDTRVRGRRVSMPAHRRDKLDTSDIHLNANIPNHAAYMIGSSLGRDALAQLYFDALTQPALTGADDPGFADLATAVRAATAQRYGSDSSQYGVVTRAWTKVGYPQPK